MFPQVALLELLRFCTLSGQYASFLQVAQHFGLAEKDFTFIGDSDQNSDLAFQQGQVDAIFRA